MHYPAMCVRVIWHLFDKICKIPLLINIILPGGHLYVSFSLSLYCIIPLILMILSLISQAFFPTGSGWPACATVSDAVRRILVF